jgi:gluconate 2-dehydrogenase gamma chain
MLLLLGLTPEILECFQTKFQYFDAQTAAQVEALAAQIIPADESGPGAKEVGVIYFIDHALATFDQDKRALYREGVAAAQGSVAKIENTAFFETLRRHTVMGFFASPAWGGNKNKAGWKLIGFDDSGVFQPPFGYYDSPENMP